MRNFGKYFLVLIVGIFNFSQVAFSQTSNTSEQFSEDDPNSTIRINHQPLSEYLGQTVLLVGRSNRIMGNEKPDSYKGSRIKTTKSLSPSRFEGSRLFLHAFTPDHANFFLAYQEGLERLSNRRSLATLNQNEQLAFWLNLYNVIVINKLVEEYPISKLKNLRNSKRGKKSFWDENITTIEGVPLSLKDIEKILFTNFDSPLVAFGLWQGSIGGPGLLNYAYSGRNVWRTLEQNAVEFVNSNRGLRPPTGSRMNVSNFYEWMMPAFGTSPDHVLMFIKEYADPNFAGNVSGVSTLRFKQYNWAVADITGGNTHTGSSNQMGGLLTGGGDGIGASAKGGVKPFSVTQPSGRSTNMRGEDTVPVSSVLGRYKNILNFIPTGSLESLPPQALDLIMGIKQNTRLPTPVITTEECAPGARCEIENVDDSGA